MAMDVIFSHATMVMSQLGAEPRRMWCYGTHKEVTHPLHNVNFTVSDTFPPSWHHVAYHPHKQSNTITNENNCVSC